MSDAPDIVTVVTEDSALAALIVERIYPEVLPYPALLPALTYQLVSQPPELTQNRSVGRWPRWRFRIWSERHADLVTIANALAAIFDVSPRSPFQTSWIDATTEGHEMDTGRFWRLVDVVGFQPGSSQ